MENFENCPKGNSKLFNAVLITLLLVVVGFLAYLSYGQYLKDKALKALDDVNYVEYEPIPTVEQAMYDWNEQKESAREYNVYISLPAPIVQALYEKLGTQKTIAEYVSEYERNEAAYISKYVSESTNVEVDKNIANRVGRIELRTTLKENEKTTTSIPLESADTINNLP